MTDQINIQVAQDSLVKARKYCEDKNYGRSFAHYLVVLQLLQPNARPRLEKEFTDVLHFWGSILHQRQDYQDLFQCYRYAHAYFPNSVEILNNWGVHILEMKHFETAKEYFERALTYNPTFLPAEQNLQSARYALVERWHFRMLNDAVRNGAFLEAIHQEISRGYDTALDIGTGTGILSVLASKSKFIKSITACDYSDTMCKIAAKVLEANKVSNVKLVRKKSNDLKIPGDLHERVNLVFTEILDSGIFGENILDTLIHAWDNLLQPKGRVIPAKVDIYITGIQSDEISHKYRIIKENAFHLDDFCVTHNSYPYDTENIQSCNITYMTDTQLILSVDFNNVEQLKAVNDMDKQNPKIKLNCISTGSIESFIVWFTLHLNESVLLSNNPSLSNQSCWDQAVINLKHPLKVTNNQLLNVQLSCKKGVLDIKCPELTEHDENCFDVPKNVILLLNDSFLIDQLQKTANILWDCYKDNKKKEVNVLDMSAFPILGLLLVQKGAFLVCRLENDRVKSLLIKTCELNNIELSHISVIFTKDFNDLTDDRVEYDIIYHNLVDSNGLLLEGEVFQAQIMRYCTSEDGFFLPKRVVVWGQLVYCEWLDRVTKLDDKNTYGCKIEEFINEYKSTEQRNIRLEKLQYECYSDQFEIGSIEYDATDVHVARTTISAKRSGKINAIFYWFELEIHGDFKVCTLRQQSFANNAAFVLDDHFECNEGQDIAVIMKQHKGIMKIFVEGTK